MTLREPMVPAARLEDLLTLVVAMCERFKFKISPSDHVSAARLCHEARQALDAADCAVGEEQAARKRPRVKVGSPEHVALWDAINRYAESCSSADLKMLAAVNVEGAIQRALDAARCER